METEQSNTEPPKRKRRWFQFSLRTLMIGVTLLAVVCGYFGRQIELVKERKGFGANPQFLVITTANRTESWMRRLLGDFGCDRVVADDKVSDSELQRCRLAFPDADVQRDKDSPEGGFHFRNGIAIGPKRQ
jgi:hypothetical protein